MRLNSLVGCMMFCTILLAGCGPIQTSAPSASDLQGIDTVAVLEFETVEEKDSLGQVIGGSLVNQQSGNIVTDIFLTGLQLTSPHQLMERNELNKLLAEKRLTETDLVEGGSASGKLERVDGLVIGKASLYDSMGGLGGGVYVTASLKDAESGRIIWTLMLKRWRLFSSPSTVANTEIPKALQQIYQR